MYYSDITNQELVKFHKKNKINADYGKININNNVIDKSMDNKAVPMFYFDNMQVSDKVINMNDKLLLYSQNTDLESTYFISSDPTRDFNVYANTSDVNSKRLLYLYLFDRETLFQLSYYPFHLKQSNGGVDLDLITNEYGNAVIQVKTFDGTFTVTSLETGKSISW